MTRYDAIEKHPTSYCVAGEREEEKKAAKMRRDSRAMKMDTKLTYDRSSLDFADLVITAKRNGKL